jgi:hypothetical protein
MWDTLQVNAREYKKICPVDKGSNMEQPV